MAGSVTTHLQNALQSRLQRHRVLVWYDAERCFDGFAEHTDLGSTRVLRLDGSYFKLRREAEPLLAALRAGKPADAVLLYVPRARLPEEQNVLLPVETAGSVYQTTLSDVAREALKGKVPSEKVDEWRALPGITLAKLDELAEGEEDIGVLAAVFGKVGAHEVGFRFLRSDEYAETIKQQKLVEPLRALLDRTFGVAIGSEVKAALKLRDAFAQRVLLHEFLDDLDEIPAKLDHLKLPERPAQVAACRELAARLRESKALEQQYRAWAQSAEELYGLRGADYDPERLGRCDTFEFEALAALQHARALAESGKWAEARAWIGERQRSFWAETDQTLRMQWHAMALAVDLWLAAAATQQALPAKSQGIARWVEWYTGSGADAGWRMDRLLRRLDALSGTLLDQPELEEVVRPAREKAASVEQTMAERFWDRLQTAPAELAAVPQQTAAFHQFVQPLVGSGTGARGRRVIYVLADALRYEMAQELAELLQPSGRVELGHAVAALPSITKIGMAALVPGAENGLELAEAGSGTVARIGGEALPGLDARRKRFAAALGERVRDISLDACLSLTGKQLEGQVNGVDLLLLRSQDLDEFGELDNLHQARKGSWRVSKMMKRHGAWAVGLLAVALTSACDADLTEPLYDGVITSLKVQNAQIATNAPEPDCEVIHLEMKLAQGGSVFHGSGTRHIEKKDITTNWILPVTGEGLDVRQPISIDLRANAVLTSSVTYKGPKEGAPGSAPPTSAECLANLGRTWKYTGVLTDLGKGAFVADFSDFKEGAHRSEPLLP